MVEKKDFEVAAMIEVGTQTIGDERVPAGPALRDANGQEHVKPEGGFFPAKIAEAGVLVRVQYAQASRAGDRVTILNHIVQSDDLSGEPLPEHANYDEMNRAVQGLFLGPALITYATNGDTEELRKLLSNGTEQINYQNSSGRTPAIQAASNGQTQSLKVLAEMKADLNQSNNKGSTPASMSAQYDQTECLKVLAEMKADLNQSDNKGYAPALMSARTGHTQSLKVLVECKVDLNQPANDGATAVFLSAQYGHVGALQVLIDAAADVNTTMTVASCHSPLTIAALEGQMSVYELLLANGADTAYKALPKHEEPFKTAGGTAEQILQERARKAR